MKKINLSITIGILLTGLLVGGIAFAPDSLGFNSVTSDGTLEAPKLTVYIDGNEVTLLMDQSGWCYRLCGALRSIPV